MKEGPERLIKRTNSICPECLEPLEASVFERDGSVWLDKECERHGDFSALLSSDVNHYYTADALAPVDSPCCGSSCGVATTPQWTNHSCTVLIEITERCNLSCPTCFAGSSPHHSTMMSFEEFTRRVEGLLEGGKAGADMIQLSGGEPTIHPRFFDMVKHLAECGFQHVTVNSNGIKLAQEAFVRRLASCVEGRNTKLFAYLQFDGFEDATYEALRGKADLLQLKNRAIENCLAHGVNVHPVMTLTRGINDHEVGEFVALGRHHGRINNVVLQPAMYSGRYDNPRRDDRLTLADAVRLVCEQSGVFEPRDFTPIPCSDPNCFGMAVAVRTSGGLIPISRYFPDFHTWNEQGVADLIARVTDTISGPQAISEAIEWALSGNVLEHIPEAEVDRLLDAFMQAPPTDGAPASEEIWKNLFVISIKPFMDAWTYDQDRIDGCCVHILDDEGNPVSFCEFNAVYRPRRDARQAAPIRLVPS